ncbi:MAG: phenylacetate--CoA ligase family protein [Pseudomonadota bacterium]
MSYFDHLDIPALKRDYPVADWLQRFRGTSRDELRALQERRFLALTEFAWKVPFYQRLWGAAGAEPGDIRSLDDLLRLPTYSKEDLMASVEAHPPLGDFHGRGAHADPPPMIFHTTSGTTGRPQPLIWGPKSREVQNMLLARIYALQGIRADDVIHSVYGFGMVNGGHYIREAVNHWVGAQILTAGTGAETPSAQQVHLMRDFGATVLVGFGDYLKRLAEVAREEGLAPGRDIKIRAISGHLGADPAEVLSGLWGGAEVFDWYGVGDTGTIAGQGPDRQGMHIFEDAQMVEVLDVDTGTPTDGPGDLVCTCLYKDDLFPVIRFNTHDVTCILPRENPLGMPFRRMEGFLGRSDNMVKLRGINVFPQSIGALLQAQFPAMTGEFVCRVTAVEGREEMEVLVEAAGGDPAPMQDLLKARLGVQIGVTIVAPGDTAALTQIEQRQKPIRLIRG